MCRFYGGEQSLAIQRQCGMEKKDVSGHFGVLETDIGWLRTASMILKADNGSHWPESGVVTRYELVYESLIPVGAIFSSGRNRYACHNETLSVHTAVCGESRVGSVC